MTEPPDGVDGHSAQKQPEPIRRRPPRVLVVLLVLAGVLLASGLIGTVAGLVKAFGAVAGESVDPSQKARILAEGISEAMNCTAFAMVVCSIGMALGLGYWLVWGRRRRRQSGT